MSRRASEKLSVQQRSLTFEENTTATLEAQNRVLERVQEKLESPVLNGGFDALAKQVGKIELIQETLQKEQQITNTKTSEIHTAIYDLEKGIYLKVREHESWIDRMKKGSKWFIAIVATGILTGIGKIIYDFISGHIHYIQ